MNYLNNLNLILNEEYYFPDEDFCFFKEFINETKTIININSINDLDTTCTIVWIFKNCIYQNLSQEISYTYKNQKLMI